MSTSINNFTVIEQQILDDFQRNMSLSLTPYAEIAKQIGICEQTVIDTIKSLQTRGVISRVGPVFTPNKIGVSTLATISVAENKIEEIAEIVNEFPEVNHNYQRDHKFNLWFVVTASSAEHLDIVLYEIEQHTHHKVMSLPMLEDYFIDLGFKLKQAN